MTESLLPPFPDELVEAKDKERAIVWLLGSLVPPFLATSHLRRWGQYTDTEITREDYQRVTRSGRRGRVL